MIFIMTIPKEFCQLYCFYSPSPYLNQNYGCSLSVEIVMSYKCAAFIWIPPCQPWSFSNCISFSKKAQIPVYTKGRLCTTKRDRTDQTIILSTMLFELVLFSATTQQTLDSTLSPCSFSHAALVGMAMHSSNAAHCSSGCHTLQVKSLLGKWKGKDTWYSLKIGAYKENRLPGNIKLHTNTIHYLCNSSN